MTWRDLSRLLSDGRPADLPVSLRRSQPIRFAQFRAQVAAAAAQLKDCRRAALSCQDSHAFAVGLLALLHNGTEVILPPNGQPGTLQTLAGTYDRLVGDEILAEAGETLPLVPIDPTQARITFFTSGSTGSAKPVTRSLALLERECATLHGVWGQSLGDRPVLATVSHQHLYGLTFKILWPLAAGWTFDAASHEVWETLLAALPPGAVVVTSPAHLARLGGIAPLPRQAQPAALFSAGSPLPAAAAATTKAIFGHLPIEIFGSTETGAFATRRQKKGGEDWILLPGNTLRVTDDGSLALSSPYVDGWVATADLVEPLPGGFRHLGRADRVVKVEGKRISLAEVEAALTTLPGVAEAAVLMLPGPEQLAAVLVLTAEGQATLQRLGTFRMSRMLRAGLATTQEAAGMPKRWRFVAALPARPLGKRSNPELAALFAKAAP